MRGVMVHVCKCRFCYSTVPVTEILAIATKPLVGAL